MDHPAPHESATSETPLRSREVAHQARRRRLMRVLRAVLLGCVVGAYTLGALNERVTPEDENDLLPVPW